VLRVPVSEPLGDVTAADIVLIEHDPGEAVRAAPLHGALRPVPFAATTCGAVSILGPVATPPSTTPPSDFRVTAIVPAFNEEDIIGSTIEYLVDNGVDVHVLDNWSTDATGEIARSYLDRGVVDVERFPAGGPTGTFDLTAILARTSAIAARHPGWCLQHDVDERRESPWGPGVGLRAALWRVQELGYNAIDHTQIDFHPVDDDFRRGIDPLTHFRWFEPPIVARDLGHTQGWIQGDAVVDLATTGGHEVRFEGRKVFPFNFLLRHYGIRSQAHGERKILRERHGRWNPDERRKGWHFGYDHIRQGHEFIRSPDDLIEFTPGFYEDYVIERLSGQTVLAAPVNPRKRAAVDLLRRAGLLDVALRAQRRFRAARRRDVSRGLRH
jgi:glycosyltransferase involved in cell wall biosynthesis